MHFADIGGWGAPGVNYQAASDDEGDAIELVSTPVSWVWEPAVGPVEPERAAWCSWSPSSRFLLLDAAPAG